MKFSITICAVFLLFNIQFTICQDSNEDNDPYDDYDSDIFISGLIENIDQLNIKLDDDLKRLEGLGGMIEEEVKVHLEPVNAMVIKSLMAQGVGGTTIATYGGKTKLVIKDNKKYNCSGQIYTDQQTKKIKCTTSFVQIPRQMDPIDVCTENTYSQVNDLYCIGDYIVMQCINGDCKCVGGQMYTLKYLRNQCGPRFGTSTYVMYQYQPNVTDPTHIPIPNPNKYVTCDEKESGRCTWYGTQLINVLNEKQ